MSIRHATAIVNAGLIALMLLGAGRVAAQTDEERRLEAIKALPYVTWTEKEVPETEHGVTVYDSTRAYDGYTLSGGMVLVDMRGNEVHSWASPVTKGKIEYARMTSDGDVYALFPSRGVCRIGWDGDVVWVAELVLHHDFGIDLDGSLLAIVRDDVCLREFGPAPIISDKITRLREGGTVEDIWRLHEHRDELSRWCSEEALTTVSEGVPEQDWSHMNTLEVIRGIDAPPLSAGFGATGDEGGGVSDGGGNAAGQDAGRGHGNGTNNSRHVAFSPGNVLICIRNLDFVGVIDMPTGEIVWGWGPGELDHPHEPSLLPNGNILVFDNGFFRGWSRVVEYDPVAEEIVWEYKADDVYDFYSRGRGGCQKLPNGNVLITESVKGRAFEVTPDGDVVWNFLNPVRGHRRRGTLYRTYRYDKDLVDRLLASHGR